MKTTLYDVVDIELIGSCGERNPFVVSVWGSFTGPDGESLRIPGFYAGGSRWVVRFSPIKTGVWRYKVESDLDRTDSPTSGSFDCVDGNGRFKGPFSVPAAYPHHFQYPDGSFHFMNVYECDWLWALDLGNDSIERTERFVRLISSYGFTGVIMNVYAHDSTWAPGKTGDDDYGPPACYAWGGTNEKPDHSRLNTSFFDHYDRVMRVLHNAGIAAHLFLKVYNKAVNWPGKGSAEDDLYFSYCVARYQAFSGVLWDFSKESFYEVDKDYILSRLRLIRRLDAYGRLRTVHDDTQFIADPIRCAEIDFVTMQQHHDFYAAALTDRYRFGKPYFNSEFGYEHGPGGLEDKVYGVAQTPEELIRRAYLVFMAGAYPAYYYTYTAWDVIKPELVPPGYAYFRLFAQWCQSLRWWEFDPSPECFRSRSIVCLARRGGDELAMFIDAGDHGKMWSITSIDFSGYTGEWMDIYSGERRPFEPGQLERLPNSKSTLFAVNPFAPHPAVVHLTRIGM